MLRYEHYVKVLCENRDMPEMKCNGQCQLGKQLKAEENPESPAPIPPTVDYEIQIFSECSSADGKHLLEESLSVRESDCLSLRAQDHPGTDTPPPRS